MFEITADELARLSDEDLRELIGRLCESELRRRGISPSCVTWGGNQNAADGGIDVRVVLPSQTQGEGFIPRPNTGFQCKAEDMPRSKVLEEMAPGGTLRPPIRNLAEQTGAYIIVSSKGSTTESALQDRINAMKEALGSIPHADDLKIEFYDRQRLETWLRGHPGTMLWARERAGKPMAGWHGHGNWSKVPRGVASGYLSDNTPRLRAPGQATESALSISEGINSIRARLREPGGVVRLVGLSGVGKTKFAEALFDPSIGESSLDRDLAAYTDVASGPSPQAMDVLEELIATQTRAILIVDNCPPGLHRRLAQSCRTGESQASIITIEYDVRDDSPEGTEVFILGDASVDLTEQLIRQRYPFVSQVDSRRVAEFSGGNARVAIAIAGTVGKDDSVAAVSDSDLLRRLFQQRHTANPSLLSAAEALSLVYSFNGEDVSDSGELTQIGGMIGKTAQEMFAYTAELMRRDLVQVRGEWRALLPQGIANKLAATALENIPRSSVESTLVTTGSERLLKSFSRRLSYLHSSKHARGIASSWLSPHGLLQEFPRLNDLGRSVFENIAPVNPEATLLTIERVLLGGDPETVSACRRYQGLLRSLAYDPALFERCIRLMVTLVEADGQSNEQKDERRVFTSLFPIYFSGTHASIEQRLAMVRWLLTSGGPVRRSLGVSALGALLEASHFTPGGDFSFGAHSRDYGYAPKNRTEAERWFDLTLGLASEFGCSGSAAAEDVRQALANKFRGLWSIAKMYGRLETVARAISENRFWREGWLAVRQTIRFDSSKPPDQAAVRLSKLEESLRPQKLTDQVRAIVLSESVTFAGMDSKDDENPDDVSFTMNRIEDRAEELGRAVGANRPALVELLPELLIGGERVWHFGRGLAQSADDVKELWDTIARHASTMPGTKHPVALLGGVLTWLKDADPQLANSLLDVAIENEALIASYPWFQAQVGIDAGGIQRLTRSLAVGAIPVRAYANIVVGHATKAVPGADLGTFLLTLSEKSGGLDVAIQILYMRILSEGGETPRNSGLVETARQLMSRLTFTEGSGQEDFRLQVLCRYSLQGDGSADAVLRIGRKLGESTAKHETYTFYHEGLITELFRAQPLAALNGFCAGVEQAGSSIASALVDLGRLRLNPVHHLPENELLAWCERDPAVRCPAAAGVVSMFGTSPIPGVPGWSNVALGLLKKAPDKSAVLREFISRFTPHMWSGSRSATIASNARLLDQLNTEGEPELAEFIAKAKTDLARVIEASRELEAYMNEPRQQGFE